MSLTKLQATLCDVFERIIINKEVFDPEYETLNFLFQAGLTPESETNQRYLQLVRTLRHEDYNVRSSTAKFLCIILFKNFNLQNRIRSLLPITILTTNYLVFNLPSYYSASVLADLRKDMKKDNAPNRDIIFWHFPKHHIPTDLSLQSLNIGPAMEEMIQLKIDPLYQFVGSVTAGNKPTVQQLKVKPGLLERKISMHFSSRSQSPNYSPSLRSERNQSTKSSQGRRKKGEELAANPKDFMSFGSRKNSRYPTITSNQSFEKTPRREGRSITITTDRSQDNSPVAQSSIALNKTPKFNETREFWMPKEYPGPNVSRQRRRTQKTVTNKSSKDISHAETSATSPHRSLLKSNTITLLDLLQKNPSPRKDLSIKLSRSRLDIQDNSDNMSPDNQSISTVRGRAKSYTNARSERSPTREFTPEGMEGGQSDMSRETMRLLKQDRHDIYKDYDKQVERMHMRPFSKEKFEVRSHDPSKFPNKISVPVVDRKKAFIDFLNAGGKVGEKPVVENNENIKGNTFHGRKWRSHMSKASLSNFGKEEKYVMLMPPIPAAIQIENKANSPVKDRKELDVIKDHLQTDVAGSQQKYISNIMEVDELDQKIYGESLKKYLDVLNYEKANYNGVDASKMGEAADLVDIIYEAKERALIKKKGAQKIRSAPIEEEEEEANVNDEDRIDKSDPRFSKHVPRSKLFIKGRSSVTSSARDSIHVAPHDNHSSLRGKRGIISPDVVRTSTGNSAALQTEISSLNATAKDGKFAKI